MRVYRRFLRGVAQFGRATASYAEGHGFKSHPRHHREERMAQTQWAYRRNAARLKAEGTGICALCGTTIWMDAPPRSPLSWTADHIVPYSRGGTHDIENLREAHYKCNSSRGNRDGPPRNMSSRIY